VAIVRELLLARDNAQVFIKTGFAAPFLRKALDDQRVEVIESRSDFGFAPLDKTLRIDREKTRALLRIWLRTWRSYVSQESLFCRRQKIDLIVSDIPPQPFIVARKLGIPSFAVSNFTWYGLYHELFGETEGVAVVRNAYELANRCLVLPFSEKELPFSERTPVGLVVRRTLATKDSVRKSLRIPRSEPLVYVGAGRSVTSGTVLHQPGRDDQQGRCDDVRPFFLITSDGTKPGVRSRIIPSDVIESQDYIASCDYVVTKPGYGTMSEAVQGQVPMLLVSRGVPEDTAAIEEATSLGIACEITEEQLASGRWLRLVVSLLKSAKPRRAYWDLPERYARDGCKDVVKAILADEKEEPAIM